MHVPRQRTHGPADEVGASPAHDTSGPDLPIASIVIPAHNEQTTLNRCLAALLRDAVDGEFDIVVVPNGCIDATADDARTAGVRVVETPLRGKAHALRLGDTTCVAFPRLYLDADVEVDCAAVRLIVAALAEDGVLAAAPTPIFDLSGTGPVIRRVHRVHDALIGPHRALAGVGVYALGREGHDRVFPMPDVLADDEFVHRSFAEHERRVVTDAHSVVRPASTVRAHLRRRVRVRMGNEQLDQLHLPSRSGRFRLATLAAVVFRREVGLLDAACYAAVAVLDRVVTAGWKYRIQQAGWSPERTQSGVVSR